MTRVLCVAEKPSIAKAVAQHLSGGQYQTANTSDKYTKNYTFTFNFGPGLGDSQVTMTAVRGHLTTAEFPSTYKSWSHPPPDSLFDAPINTVTTADCKAIARNIETLARSATVLIIWTDCDREGEHIGSEIRDAAFKGNRNIQVKRARFSNVERSHILSAARRLVALDQKQVDAVAARIELDLRIGFAFTRFLTNNLRGLGGPMAELMISYGSCQFPTLGFVVDRYFRVKNFVPEAFWSIKLVHEREGMKVNFNWARNRLFDRAAVTILYERCLRAREAVVKKVQEKPTKKWKPLPLTTVELQKMATRFLRMTGQQAMTVAEKLYNKGFISYPRTETDRFDKGMNLRGLVEKQFPDGRWGGFARELIEGGRFNQPRQGKNDDKAHPPIHPITYAAPTVLDEQERKVYEFVVRRFLACCSDDAKGMATDVEVGYGEEMFAAHGVIVLERNYLDVYPYENWTGTAMLPKFEVGERFEPTEAMMTEGKTSPPSYLTEADLIALMDANGIGTDATMAEHIEKIQERQYVVTVPRGGGGGGGGEDDNEPPAAAGRGRGRGRGRGGRAARGGRGGARGGGAGGGGGGNGVKEFIPTSLGVALIMGFDRMSFEISLGKPFLRKETELMMKAICEGRSTKQEFLQRNIHQYRTVYHQSSAELNTLKAVSYLHFAIHLQIWHTDTHTGLQTIRLQQRQRAMNQRHSHSNISKSWLHRTALHESPSPAPSCTLL
ncbi:putative DNA topoisomerase 3 [Cercophora samala]|uniref:DNA topoisomerase n=1 Tax=Cercophora samala TaxID=330535 RepID=A0AA39Z8C2_9PEZI|nr:putative DNA topoisomerase 3 [Cercophora samala]